MSTSEATLQRTAAAGERAWSAAKTWRLVGRLAVYLVLVSAAVVFFLPFYWVLIASFKTPAELRAIPPTWWPETFTLANYPAVWRAAFARYFLNSFIYAGGTTLVVVFTSSLIGYVIVKDPSRLGNMVFWFILAASMVPFVTYLLPLFKMLLRFQEWLRIPVVNTYWGMILPWVVFPFGVFLMRQAMYSVPNDLLDAARIDGATEFGIYRQVVLPLVRHNLAALAIIVFIFKYDDLLWPLVVAQRTEMYPVTVGLVEYVGQFFIEYHLFTTAAVLAIIPIFVIYLVLQRYIIEGIATQGLKG
ncbi:MAG TPA: carbohydrate ABC transporter permease [Caldilineaceae bacterium]|nr:carbohydrate ABC transporter permease [Caldilineaceae bacterium]